MSRIQEILKKAEREGSVHRTRALDTETPSVGQALADPPTVLIQPVAAPPPPAATGAPPLAPVAAPRVREVIGGLDHRLVAAVAPQSLAAEQYRSLRTRVTHSENGRAAARVVIITSPSKGDGKSLTAANLALTMAQEFQQRVLLLDADLRRPSLHRLFGVAETPGLSDLLMGGATLDEALVSIRDHHLTLLPSGIIPMHPAELLGSTAMRRVIDTLRGRFDRILIDMPPVAPLADVAVASTLADGVLMIVRAGVTPKPAIEAALSNLDTAKVLGLVLNDAGASRTTDGYGGYGYVAG
jgi:capsular exopolysaccharide synthesis family protein